MYKYRLLHAKSAILSECVARVIYRHSFAWNKVFKARISRHLIVPHVCIANNYLCFDVINSTTQSLNMPFLDVIHSESFAKKRRFFKIDLIAKS